jgi:putative flippase GtrA
MTFLRYIGVQLVAFGIDIGVFLFFYQSVTLDAVCANVIGKITAGGFAFLVHRTFTFEMANQTSAPRQAIGYFALIMLNIPLSSLALILSLRVLDSAVLSKLLAEAICVSLNYALCKYLVFARRD